ncbi:MAG: LysR family transcriptional regulator [Desulfobaccales bacterium]
MEWQQLLGFCQLARLGSFTKAAEATFRTQSALSQQLKALEAELGTPLVERLGRRRVVLTPAGELLLDFAEKTLEHYERLRAEVAALRGIPHGRLKLAAPFTTLYHLLGRPLKEFSERFPHVRLTILDRPQAAVFDLVRNREVELGFARESAVPRDLAACGWLKVQTCLMVPPDHPLTGIPQPTWEEMVRFPLILPPPGPKITGDPDIETLLKREGLSYHVVMESSNVELSAQYVEMGLGISFATWAENLDVTRRRLVLLPLGHYFPPDHLAVVRRRDRESTGYGREFLTLLGRSAATAPEPDLKV